MGRDDDSDGRSQALAFSGTADGTELPININLSHIDTGDVLLVITAVGAVSQPKQAVKNTELIASLVEYPGDAVLGTSFGGFITSRNPAVERMYGYSDKEIIGKSIDRPTPEVERAS